MTHSRVVAPAPAQPRPSIRKVLRHSWMVAAGAVIGLAAAAVVTSSATPLYTARASLQFTLAYTSSATDINQGATYTRSEVLSYAELATSTTVLQPVVRQLDLDLSPGALAGRISVTTPPDTSVLHVAATAPSAEDAAELANAVANSLSTYVVAQSPADEMTGPLLEVTTIASASAPNGPSSPRAKVNLAAGLLLGLLGGVLATTVALRADTRLRTGAEIAAVTDAPVLGTLERHRSPGGSSQGMRHIAAALRHSLAVQPASTLVCTPVARDADIVALTESLAANLSGIGVRCAAIAEGSAADDDETTPLHLDSTQLRLLALQEENDTVLVATPSMSATADAATLASVATGAVLVVHAGAVRVQQLHAVLQQLAAVGLPVRGIILDEGRTPTAEPAAAETPADDSAPASGREGRTGSNATSEPRRAQADTAGEPDPESEQPDDDTTAGTTPVQSLQRG